MKYFVTLLLLLVIQYQSYSQTPIHSYNLNGSLNEVGGSGPTLIPNGGAGAFVPATVCGTAKNVYQFAAGQGLDYPVGATFTNTYSVEMVFEFDVVTGYRRVLDYKNLTLDDGIYVINSNLTFYPVTTGTGTPMVANTYEHVIVTRNAGGTVNIYVNGCLHLTFNDASNRSITDATNKLVFFKDNGSENSAGSVSEIHVFDVELTAAQANARFNTFCPSGPGSSPTPEVYEYLFNGNFAETSGKTALIPLSTGTFGPETFSNCGATTVYNFDQHSGLQFDNTAAANFFGDEYTIELYFKFTNLTSWRRIIDYKNRTSDTGPYAFNNAIQFYNVVTSGSFPFVANTYAHVVLTREVTSGCSSAKTVNMYVDGTLRATFSDPTDLGTLSADNVLNFFRDDLVVGNEASAGSIALMRLYNYVLLPADVSNTFGNIPCPILLNNPSTLLSAERQEKEVFLQWTNNLVPTQADYELERSFDAVNWETIATNLPWSQIAFADFNSSAHTTYYRLKINWDQQYIYSNTVAVAPLAGEDFVIYPNPVQGGQLLTISSNFWAAHQSIQIEVVNALGQEVFRATVTGNQAYQIRLPDLTAGMYGLRISSESVAVSKFHKLIVKE